MMEIIQSVIDALSTCCLSCREQDVEAGESTERSPLLNADERITNLVRRRLSENNMDNDISNSYPSREKDEQTALNRIVQETNSNIIDVAALDTNHILEQSEYNDRVKLYNHRLSQHWSQLPVAEISYNGLLRDLPNPENLLFYNPKIEDISTAKNFIKDAAQAINDMKIDNQEDLVVPFQIK